MTLCMQNAAVERGKNMKLSELLNRYEEWKHFWRIMLNARRNAELCKDAALTSLLDEMIHHLVQLTGKPVELDPVELAEVEKP